MAEAANMVRMRKPRFNRGLTWVAVRVLAKNSLMPGDVIPDNYKRHVLQRWWRLGWIGPKDDEWTKQVLEAHARREEMKTGKRPDYSSPPPAPEPIQPVETVTASDVEIEQAGGGWYVIRDSEGAELAKIRGAEATNEWLEANGYEAML